MNKTESQQRLEKRIAKLTSIPGVKNNQASRGLIWAQEMNRYTTGIVEHDVLEGMSPEMYNEFRRQLKRMSVAHFYNEFEQIQKTKEQLKKADRGEDRLNPRFLLAGSETNILISILKGDIDIESLIWIELAARGLDGKFNSKEETAL